MLLRLCYRGFFIISSCHVIHRAHIPEDLARKDENTRNLPVVKRGGVIRRMFAVVVMILSSVV